MFLVVDDSDSFRDLLTLELGPDCTRTASSIAEGLRLAKLEQPQVILLDQWFGLGPVMGMEAIPAFRAVAPDALIVMLTADRDRGDIARAIEAGAVGYVEKGDMEDLRRTLVELAALEPVLLSQSKVVWRRQLVAARKLH